MKVKKLLKNSLRYVPQVLVLFSVLTSNVFFPALAIAQELESSIDIPVIDDSEDILEDGISTSIYEEGIYTVHTVVENQEYVYPDNVDVRVRFNEVSEDGNLVIKRVVLSEEEKSSLNTSDDYGWDITSSMSNGSFNYDLTLPNTQGDDVEVKYTEDGSTYVNTGEFTVNEGSLVITDLDHFTIFVVSGIDNSGTCTGASITEPSGTSACYNTIQAAINAASTESEIYVDSSYDSSFEAFPILVNKEVKIYGAQKGVDPRPSVGGRTGSETVVDGRSLTGDSIFKVTVNNVTIEGFTIKNGYVDYGAVYVGSVKNTKILRNIFLDNYADLYIVGEGSSIFEGNKSSADNSGGAWGSIVIENSSNNEIKNNYISKKYSSQFVIYLSNSSNNKIFDNILDKNNIGATPGSFYSAIYLETSSNNEIRRNTVSENLNNGGISLNAQSNNNIVSKNIITNNNIPTQPEGIKGSGIFLESSDSNTVTGNTIKEQKAGIRLENSSSNEIKVNILDQNDNGINLYYTGIENENKNNKIKYNEIYNNISQGIYFQGTPGQYQDNSTTISFNNIYGNGKGIHYDGTNTVIAGSNWWGNLTGPSVATPVVGQGDLIVGDITYKEWLCEPYSTNWISQNGVCSIEAPSTLGWNISSLTSNPGETPTKLSCDSYTSDNTPSHVWSGVQVKNVKYQRQAKTPTGGWWTDPMIYTETHTPVVWFGNKTNGVEGEWNTRVRAWIDTNENGTWDDTDLTSNWSNECKITYDKTAPSIPGLTFPTHDQHLNAKDLYIDWEESTDNFTDRSNLVYEYRLCTSEEKINNSIDTCFNVMYTGTTRHPLAGFASGTGEYDNWWYTVQAIDEAGNKSGFAEARKFVIDNTNPQGSIDYIYYDTADVQGTSFITNDNTPILGGTCSDNNEIESMVLRIVNLSTNTKDKYNVTCTNGAWQYGPIDQLDDGSYRIVLVIKDKAGNKRRIVEKPLIIDTVAPRAEYTQFKDAVEIVDPIAYVKAVTQLSFTAKYEDDLPSAGLNQDSYVIFDAQDDGSFRFSADDKKAYCSWRSDPNRVILSGTTQELTEAIQFSNCIDSLPDGEYYMAHHVYDNATRKDIPSINQFRDVLGLHFVVDSTNTEISNITITKDGTPAQYVKEGDSIKISATVIDTSSGIKAVSADFSYNPTYTNRPTPRNTKMYHTSGDTYEATFTIPAGWNEGELYITVAGSDNVSNYNPNRGAAQQIIIDNTKPEVTFDNIVVPEILSDEPAYSMGEPSEDLSAEPVCNIDEGITFPIDAESENNLFTVTCTYSDLAGNENSSTYTVTVTNVPVTFTLSATATEVLAGTAPIALSTTVTNGNPTYTYLWSDDCTGTDPQTTFNPTTPGGYTCTVTVTDADGDTATNSIDIAVGAVAGAATTNPSLLNTVRTAVNKIFGTNTGTGSGSEILAETQETILEETLKDEEVLGEQTITCENPKPIKGYIYLDKNKNDEMDKEEKGIENVSIRIYTIYEGNEITIAQLKTDEYGYWQSDICPGDYSIEIDQESLPKNLETEEILSVNVNDQEIGLDISATDTRNFWQKYWYIILLVAALLITTVYIVATRKKEEVYNQ